MESANTQMAALMVTSCAVPRQNPLQHRSWQKTVISSAVPVFQSRIGELLQVFMRKSIHVVFVEDWTFHDWLWNSHVHLLTF